MSKKTGGGSGPNLEVMGNIALKSALNIPLKSALNTALN